MALLIDEEKLERTRPLWIRIANLRLLTISASRILYSGDLGTLKFSDIK